MNRLASLSDDTLTVPGMSSVTAAPRRSLLSALGTAETSRSLATFSPVHYERGYAYPLLIWLHGNAGNEGQLRQVMPLVSQRNHVGVAPRGTACCAAESEAYAWKQSADHIARAEQRILDCITTARVRFNVHSDRVFIAGYGSGGTMAVRMAWNHPELFAGAATLCGPLPTTETPLRHLNKLRGLPTLLASGRDARHFSEPIVCRDLRLLHSAGMIVALRQYPCGDELRTTMLADLDRWMMEIILGTGAATQS